MCFEMTPLPVQWNFEKSYKTLELLLHKNVTEKFSFDLYLCITFLVYQ